MSDIGRRLEDMLEGQPQPGTPQIPMFSTVLGRAVSKCDRLDASYWRRNLQSPVLFSAAVQEALNSIPKEPACFIEVGPHCPLAGPLRQIFLQSSLQSSPQYISTLSKGQNQVTSILETAGQLFLKGMPINFVTINTTGSARILTDLPPYPWDYSRKLWRESTIAKSWRLRKYAHHELLGSRVPESSDLEPMWRNLIRLEDSSWLLDHKLAGDVVYPGVGHVASIGEAVRQVTGIGTGYEIRNLFIRHALVLDENSAVEVITTLRPERLTDVLDSEWYDFKICSKSNREWTKHCTGQVRASQGPEASIGAHVWPPFIRKVDASKWYDYLGKIGLTYGPEFQGMSSITAHPTEDKAAAMVSAGENVLDIAAFAAHPTMLDSCLRMCIQS
jgi:acyl transferase domain-containing protein